MMLYDEKLENQKTFFRVLYQIREIGGSKSMLSRLVEIPPGKRDLFKIETSKR